MSQFQNNSQIAGWKCYYHSKNRFTLRDIHLRGLEQYMICGTVQIMLKHYPLSEMHLHSPDLLNIHNVVLCWNCSSIKYSHRSMSIIAKFFSHPRLLSSRSRTFYVEMHLSPSMICCANDLVALSPIKYVFTFVGSAECSSCILCLRLSYAGQ